ncbi:sugar phosphate isomerase/epimerase family protein [Pelagicoccus mobilis]|uniref:Sugar phosphate isomerase/epimerase n=1 Tax=Pelagicoccus mobilis TaxID=415221 RepID=A0A934VP40_9BACT|nr:sugar phosphate isomerase/epimerase [Pelagicoccus mobilis]MBK1876877.1 sugar phosphate isomerase/epimerase [Pelagicoccus mobilis]
MKIDQIAAITYTIRDFIQSEKNFQDSCQKLAQIGYQAVELAALPQGMISAKETLQICNDNGLRITSTHEDLGKTLDEPETLVDHIKDLGCEYIIYSYPHDTDFNDPASVDRLIDRLNRAGAVYKEAGLNLLYHNHALEFLKRDGKIVLDTILERTDPDLVKAELDTFWIQRGGCDPVTWCQKVSGRLPILHIKDMTVYEGNESTMGEIGSGNLDFKRIISAAEASGCETFVVEQDECPGNPFDSLKKSFDYIKGNLVD